MGKIAIRHDVRGAVSAAEVLSWSGLQWEPELVRPATKYGPDDSSGFRAMVNPSNGRTLAYVGRQFTPNSHVRPVEALDGLIKGGVLAPVGVSVWDHGAMVAIQMRPTALVTKVGARSSISPLLTLMVRHDGKGTDHAFFADFDFWCKNQAGQVAQVKGQGVSHRASVQRSYGDLVEQRLVQMTQDDALLRRYYAMQQIAGSHVCLLGSDLYRYWGETLGFDYTNMSPSDLKVAEKVADAWVADDHGQTASLWHAYSAVTRYLTHVQGRDAGVREERALMGNQDVYMRALQGVAVRAGLDADSVTVSA